LRVDHAAAGVEVAEHALGVDLEAGQDAGQVAGHEGDERRGVRERDTLRGGVADVPLVPEGDVLQGRDSVAADQPGEPADALAEDRVALVRHRRGALLLASERLERLGNLAALEMADFEGDALHAGGGQRQGVHEGGVAVAAHDLRRGRVDRESQSAEDLLLDTGIERRVGADDATQLPGRDLGAGGPEAVQRAVQLGDPAGDLEAERDRLRVDAMRAAGHQGPAVLDGEDGGGGPDGGEILEDDVG
jgi:hypothetical protein